MIPKQIISQQDMRDAHMSEIISCCLKMQSCAITIKAGSYWSARRTKEYVLVIEERL